MIWHIRYWLARLRNEFRQLTLRRSTDESAVAEVMGGLKRDPTLRQLLHEAEAKMRTENGK